MLENELFDLIIVGGGPCGLTAGIYAMRAALKTVLIESSAPGGQIAITKGVENYPGFDEIPGLELSDKILKHAQSYGLKVTQQEVVALDPGPDFHAVRLAGGEVLRAHAVILAVGGRALKLGIPGEIEYFGRGVSYCATCDGFFFKDATVAVVGGGDSALEEAIYLSKIAGKVYLLHRRDTFRASKIMQRHLLAEPKIEVVFNTIVTAIKGNGDGVTGVDVLNTQTDARQELAAEGVFIFVGFSPNNHLVPALVEINPRGYVITDEKCETRIPGLFVAGDLRQKYANQIIIAAADGCTAALAAARYVELKKAGISYNEVVQ